jgi:histidine triad (HIT) family protein
MDCKKSLRGALVYMGLLFISGCTSPIKTPQKLSDWQNILNVTQNTQNHSQYFITPKTPISYIADLNFTNPNDIAFAQAVVMAAIDLSHTHADADFQMHIFHKNGQLCTAISLYPVSVQNSFGSNCPFCPPYQLRGAIIDENNTTLAIEKSTPARSPINFLIIPKAHIVNYKDRAFNTQIFIEQLSLARKLANKLTNPTDVELYVNNGANAGQTVFHSHMHFESNAEWKK